MAVSCDYAQMLRSEFEEHAIEIVAHILLSHGEGSTVQQGFELMLRQADLDWNADARSLTVHLPAMRLSGPEIDIESISEYRDGAILLALTDAEKRLDAANRKAAREELLKQARGATPMRLAQNAARAAVEQSFAMPLKAAGVDAKVKAVFDGGRGAASAARR